MDVSYRQVEQQPIDKGEVGYWCPKEERFLTEALGYGSIHHHTMEHRCGSAVHYRALRTSTVHIELHDGQPVVAQ